MYKLPILICLIVAMGVLVQSYRTTFALQGNLNRIRAARGLLIRPVRQAEILGSGNGFANGSATANGGSENAWSSTNGASQGSVSLVSAGSATNAGQGPPFGAPPTAIGGGNTIILGSGNGTAQAGAIGSSGTVNSTTGGGGTASGTRIF